MGEWLFKEDNYIPCENKDKFLDKSIFAILKVLSSIKRYDNAMRKKVIYKLNPAVKLLSAILLAVLVSLSRYGTYIMLIGFFVIAGAFLLERENTKRVFLLAGAAAFFVTITLIPSMFLGNIKNSLVMILKTLITVILVNTLSYSTKWYEAARALKLFFVPDIFIMVFEITLRYIFILGEAALEMLYALKLKSIGKSSNKYMPLSSIIGNLFLKSKEMGEEMYYAMECRGFTGEYSAAYNFKLSLIDWIFILYNLLLVAGYFISIRF